MDQKQANWTYRLKCSEKDKNSYFKQQNIRLVIEWMHVRQRTRNNTLSPELGGKNLEIHRHQENTLKKTASQWGKIS